MRFKEVSLLAATIAVAACFYGWAGCSGDRDSSPTSLEEAFLKFESVEMVSFTIKGRAECDACANEEIPIMGWQLEVVKKNNSLNVLGIYSYESLGPFTVPKMRVVQNEALALMATLFRDGDTGPAPIYGYAEINPPADDDSVVNVIINFPSRDEE